MNYVFLILCFLICQFNSFSQAATTPPSFIGVGTDAECPMTISVEVYPQEIKYGDICFGRFFATNTKEKPVNCVYSRNFLDVTTTKLFSGDELLQIFNVEFLDEHDGFCQSVSLRDGLKVPNHVVRHNETILFHIKPIWLPIPEFSSPELPSEDSFYKLRSAKFDTIVSAQAVLKLMERNTESQKPLRDARLPDVLRYGITATMETSEQFDFKKGEVPKTHFSPVTVASPLPQSEAGRFRYRWFLEHPKSNFDLAFRFEGIDMPLCKADGSEFEITYEPAEKSTYTFIPDIFTKEELQLKGYKLSNEVSTAVEKGFVGSYNSRYSVSILPRSNKILNQIHQWYLLFPNTFDLQGHWIGHGLFAHPHHAIGSPYHHVNAKEEYEKFFISMRTRTPELLKRIKRTKELEAELLKLPDSELSQNMKEFIQLRGHLVDIRFAENATEENKAFDNFVKFIDKSKDKELWIRFVIEIGFNSIVDHEYFPYKKAEDYCKRFTEKFATKIEVIP
ncbi:MAG: hypothetical protein LBJ00_00320 [Planctomycetaceae bacterium]|nr:hypothetical protein [Planctomycetaceae bacterium]